MTVKYFARDILSAKYKIALVFIPEDIKADTEKKDQYASSLKVTVNQNGENLYTFPGDKYAAGIKKDMYTKTIRPDMAVIDTVFLKDDDTGEDFVFDFKTCENFSGISTKTFEDKDYTLEITVETAKPAKNKLIADSNYNKKFRLDKILIVPVEEDDSSSSSSSSSSSN